MICYPCRQGGDDNQDELFPHWMVENTHAECIDRNPLLLPFEAGQRLCTCQHRTGKWVAQ